MKSKDILQIKSIDKANIDQIRQLAGLYADVFAGPPWNEVTKCATSSKFYGKDTQAGTPCPDCQNPLLEAYPKDETVGYILGELGKSNPIGLLAYVNSELAGFSWGYETNLENVAQSKWKTPQMQQSVQKLLESYGVKDKLFYGSETGLSPAFQGLGIGKKLIRNRLDKIVRTGENYVLIRTNVNSNMYGICKEIEGFDQILGPVSSKGFLSRKWKQESKYINGQDLENPNRVLFLYDERKRASAEENRKYYTSGPGWYGMH